MIKVYGTVDVKLKLKNQDPTFTGSEVLQRLSEMIENNAYVPRQPKSKAPSNEIGQYKSSVVYTHALGVNVGVTLPDGKH